MNGIQMQYEFDNLMRNHEKLKGLDYSSDDVEMWLNDSQSILFNKYQELYNKEAYARTVLNKLHRTKRYLANEGFTNTTNNTNGTYFPLPSDLRSVIPDLEEVTFTLNSTTYRSRVKDIIGTHYNLNKFNPFKKPYEDMVWRIIYGRNEADATATNAHQIILPDDAVLTYYFIQYLKEPISISIENNSTSELHISVHEELVIEAVKLFLKSVENNLSLKKN